ncbi:MAG: tyrosine-type recombinase/integrase [Chloroflexota bacterium]
MSAPTLSELAQSWVRHLRAENKSARTEEAYTAALRLFEQFLHQAGMPTEPAQVRREHVEAFIAAQLAAHSPATAAQRYRSLRTFWTWAQEEGETQRSPMERMKPPSVPEKAVPVISDDDLSALLKATEGTGFEERRDHAILRVLLDTGMRRGELIGIRLTDVDFDQGVLFVVGKGARPRACPFGSKTARALDRYLRARKAHRDAPEGWLWLGLRGRMTDSGIHQMLERRCQQAGIERVHAHAFRHTASHRFLAAGGQESDLMRLHGWRSRQMVNRYGASAADERAREAHRRMALGDKL